MERVVAWKIQKHQNIQVKWKHDLQTHVVFAEIVHAWSLHGLRCLRTHDMPLKIHGFNLHLSNEWFQFSMNVFQCWNPSSTSADSPLGSQTKGFLPLAMVLVQASSGAVRWQNYGCPWIRKIKHQQGGWPDSNCSNWFKNQSLLRHHTWMQNATIPAKWKFQKYQFQVKHTGNFTF